MSEEKQSKGKWGESHVAAMWRQGLRELRAALYPDSNVAQQTEYGIAGTVTPGEVQKSRDHSKDDRGERNYEPDNHDSVLTGRMNPAEGRSGDREMEMER